MKIICIGRNYVDHIKELNNPVPTAPVFFLKPDSALLTRNRPFYHPDFSGNIHHEVELVLKICKVGKHIQKKFAHSYYKEIAVGLDLTARDIQDEAKQKGLPWTIAKGFDQSAPISPFIPKEELGDPANIHFHLMRNGNKVQEGNSKLMIYPFDDIIAAISQYMTLRTGDLIFTGTPAGVGKINPGDKLEAYIGERLMLTCVVR